MITKPPPNESAPTFSATHASAPSPPTDADAAPIAGSGSHPEACAPDRHAPDTNSSITPQPSSTSTRYGPIVAAETAPATMYASQRSRRPRARRQLGHASPDPARTATAATAAPAPAPAPRTHSGGELDRNNADSARIRTTAGRMKPSPPTSAP